MNTSVGPGVHTLHSYEHLIERMTGKTRALAPSQPLARGAVGTPSTHAFAARAAARPHADAPLDVAVSGIIDAIGALGRTEGEAPGRRSRSLAAARSRRRSRSCPRPTEHSGGTPDAAVGRGHYFRPLSPMDDGRQTAGHVSRAARPEDKAALDGAFVQRRHMSVILCR